jgi:hypothetical protein
MDETACNSCRLEAIFPFSKASRLALRPKQPPIQLVNKVLSPVVKQPGMMLTTHFYLVLRLSISGRSLPIPLYACIEYTVTSLLLYAIHGIINTENINIHYVTCNFNLTHSMEQ